METLYTPTEHCTLHESTVQSMGTLRTPWEHCAPHGNTVHPMGVVDGEEVPQGIITARLPPWNLRKNYPWSTSKTMAMSHVLPSTQHLLALLVYSQQINFLRRILPKLQIVLNTVSLGLELTVPFLLFNSQNKRVIKEAHTPAQHFALCWAFAIGFHSLKCFPCDSHRLQRYGEKTLSLLHLSCHSKPLNHFLLLPWVNLELSEEKYQEGNKDQYWYTAVISTTTKNYCWLYGKEKSKNRLLSTDLKFWYCYCIGKHVKPSGTPINLCQKS